MLPERTKEQSPFEHLTSEDRLFLAAIQNEEKRNEVISILKRAGLIPA
jgi:hypothetical protein